MYARNLSSSLLAALSDTPVTLLLGARQTGKSTLARSLTEQGYLNHYLTLDSAVLLSAARNDPEGFFRNYTGSLVIDEIQKAPELLPAIKLTVDQHRAPGRFLLTGSANPFVMPQVSESLAGRMETLILRPLSQGELAGVREDWIDRLFGETFSLPPTPSIDKTDLVKRLAAGGYPESLARLDEGRRHEWFESYLSAVLFGEIRDISSIEGFEEMPRLMTLVAARTGSTLNVTDVASQIGLSQRTIQRYLTLLQATFLIEVLPAWFRNVDKRLTKSPKLFLNDSGLMTALLGLNETRLLNEGEALGRVLQSFVAAELQKQISWSATKPRLYHFRSAQGREVDFVLEDRPGCTVGIEVKAGATVTSSDFTGLRTLAETAGKSFLRGVILYTGAEAVPFGKDFFALPLNCLWQSSKTETQETPSLPSNR